jgi:glutamate-ammonia-ligase adenylyltransferase
VAGNSRFLARWLARETGWIADLAEPVPPAPAPAPADADWRELRRTKYRGLLRVYARDAVRPFDAGLGELSDLADGILRRALALAAGDHEPPALFALGKLGGQELNFSSDVDLLFVCEAPPDERGHDARERAAAVVRELKRRLDEPTADGFAYRVDLDLRPEGPPGALVRGVEGTLGYYELRGAEWERQMLLRLRHLAGSPGAARAFERGIEPFVYRRAIDPSVIDAVRAMKARIESERRERGRDLDANLKEAPGGIRDVEFTVQALQLFHAGWRPELRTGNVLAAIAGLARAGILPETSAEVLERGYRWLRRAEHALQLAEEQQTAQLPRDAAERTAVARRMGYAGAEAAQASREFEAELARTQSQVREQFEALVLGSRAS